MRLFIRSCLRLEEGVHPRPLPPVQLDVVEKHLSSCIELGRRHQLGNNGNVATVTPNWEQLHPVGHCLQELLLLSR